MLAYMPDVTSARFSTTCATAFSNNYDTCGTITRASMAMLTPADLDTLFYKGGLFADLNAWFTTQIEMKACGVPTNGLYDWIMSGSDRTKAKSLLNKLNVDSSPSLLFPFILAKQDSVINTDYWAVTGGAANSAYTGDLPATAAGTFTAGPLTAADKALGAAGDRVIRVVSRYGVDLDPKWFQDRTVVHIFSRAAGVAQDGAWKVLASEVATDLSYVDVLVKSQNAGSSTAFAAAPTSGVLLEGVNNVNDFERWCHNKPNYDGKKRVPFWFQTMRRTRCVNSQYIEFYKRLNQPGVNEAFRQFGDLTLAQRNAQDEMNYQKAFVNAFFFNKPISASQTLAGWESLEAINTFTSSVLDPGTGGSLIGRRANFIGVKEQLYRCNRYKDVGNQPLNLAELLLELYNIRRSRQNQGSGRVVTDIDIYTDTTSRADFMRAYIDYMVSLYGSTFRLTKEIPGGSNPELGFVWDTYRFPTLSGLNVNIVSHDTFDDYRSAMAAEGTESLGIRYLILDMGAPGPRGGTIYWAQIASNRKVHTSGELEKLAGLTTDWACVMENITSEVTLTSDTGTVIVSCPSNSLWIENIAVGKPIVTGETDPYTDLK